MHADRQRKGVFSTTVRKLLCWQRGLADYLAECWPATAFEARRCESGRVWGSCGWGNHWTSPSHQLECLGLGSAVSSLRGVWDGAPPEIEFKAFSQKIWHLLTTNDWHFHCTNMRLQLTNSFRTALVCVCVRACVWVRKWIWYWLLTV